MIITGIIIALLIQISVPNNNSGQLRIFGYINSIIITILVWEGNLRIDSWLNQRYPWITRPAKRIFIHLFLSVAYSAITMFLLMLIISFIFDNQNLSVLHSVGNRIRIISITLGTLVLVSVFLLSIEISTQFYRHWKKSLVEVEKYRTESLQAQLQNLKNQINPHFLFNNLSVLSSLVYKDQDKAVEFINQLSKVYRYLLENRNNELVTLENELTFISSYSYLLTIRFERNIRISADVPRDKLAAFIPPMSLQMLVENAIKHNEATEEHPLKINIGTQGNFLVVSNNLHLRSHKEETSKIGLRNIRDRYRFFTDLEVEVKKENDLFEVKIPILLTA